MRFLDFVGGPGCKTWKVGQVQPADGGARLWWMYRIHEDFATRCQFFDAYYIYVMLFWKWNIGVYSARLPPAD
jgi:hypothetical protein